MAFTDEDLAEMRRHDEHVQRQIDQLTKERDDARREVESLSRDLQIARNERGLVEAARDSAQERENHALADRETAWRKVAVAEAAMVDLAKERDAWVEQSRKNGETAEEYKKTAIRYRDRVDELESEARMLAALRSAGVDNWEGYDVAMEIANRAE